MLFESEACCLRKTKLAILQRTERAMVRTMCRAKVMDRKNTDELMDMLGLDETMDKMAKTNRVMVWSCFKKRRR